MPAIVSDMKFCAGKKAQTNVEFEKRGGWKATSFIFGLAACDLLSSLGLSVNLISYLTSRMNLGLAEAANTVTNFGGMCSFSPILGAILADAYVGRYWMMICGALAYILGLGLFTAEATIRSWIKAPCHQIQNGVTPVPHVNTGAECNHHSTKSRQLGYTYLVFCFIAMGAGGVRSAAGAFGADQFDVKDPEERKQSWRFFNWFYFWTNFALLFATTILVYIQENVGWGWGFGIVGIAVVLSFMVFLAGSNFYRRFPPSGSPFTRLVQVMVAAFRKRHLRLPFDPSILYVGTGKEPKVKGFANLSHTPQFRFLDKAALLVPESDIIDSEGTGLKDAKLPSFDPWKLCSVHQVEELKALLRMIPIWAVGMIVFTAWVQQNTLWVQQARTMDRHIKGFKLPPGCFSVFSNLTLLSWVPIYDRFVLPLARRLTGQERGITFLQRIGAGSFICIFAMLLAGLVEMKRRHVAISHGLINRPSETVPMSAFWLVPQYCILGFSESFIIIGYLEFLYDQSPQSMRSMATAILWAIVGAANFLSTLLISIISKFTQTHSNAGGWLASNLNKGRLEYFYWLLAALLTVNFVIYQIFSARYTYTKFDMDQDHDEGSSQDKVDIRVPLAL